MTPNEINIAIAEWCGWKYERLPKACVWISPADDGWHESPPNYHADLNAIAEAEKKLDYMTGQLGDYHAALGQICRKLNEGKPMSQWQHEYRATAPQRCEALLKTIGKWKE
jgi:hypothetical protein